MSICAVPHSDVFLYCLTRMGAQNITSFSRSFYVKATRNSLGMFHKVFQGTQISSLKVSNVEYFWTLHLHHGKRFDCHQNIYTTSLKKGSSQKTTGCDTDT